jgi:DNA-binding transcriptional LysR family regulator
MKRVPHNLIETFLIYMQSRSVVLTARQLGVSQPAVTLQLQRLTELVGKPLFLTAGRRKEPTPFARDLAIELSEPFQSLQKSIHLALTALGADENLSLRIACRSEAISRLAPRLKFPGKVIWTGRTKIEATDDLKNGLVDFAILSVKPDLPGILAKTCLADRLVLISPLNSLPKIDPKVFSKGRTDKSADSLTTLLQKLRWIVYNEQAPFAREFLKAAKIEISHLKSATYCEDWRAIVGIVEKGMGVSVVPEGFVTDKVHKIILPDSMMPKTQFYIAASKLLLNLPVYRSAWNSL